MEVDEEDGARFGHFKSWSSSCGQLSFCVSGLWILVELEQKVPYPLSLSLHLLLLSGAPPPSLPSKLHHQQLLGVKTSKEKPGFPPLRALLPPPRPPQLVQMPPLSQPRNLPLPPNQCRPPPSPNPPDLPTQSPSERTSAGIIAHHSIIVFSPLSPLLWPC